jgi:predicted kinase
VASPTLVVVSGPPGAGKTTLAHTIAAAIGCPAVCRDEIKEGMVHARLGTEPGPGDDLDLRTLATFFDVVRLLLTGGVTVVAEAAFQDKLWRPALEPLLDLAAVRIIQCTVDDAVAHARVARRLEQSLNRAAHDDRAYLQTRTTDTRDSPDSFVWIALAAPTLRVDTNDGYHPQLPEILAFVNGSGGEVDRTLGDGPVTREVRGVCDVATETT